MSAAALPRRTPARLRLPAVPAEGIRLTAVLLAGAYAFSRWMGFVTHPPGGVAPAALGAALLLGLVVVAAGRLRPGVLRGVLVVAAVAGALAIALLASGVPAGLLAPRRWGGLSSGLGSGISALPGLNVPYDGVNDWARTVLLLSGILLLLVAVVGAAWPRRGFAVAGLGVLFAIPAIELHPAHPWRSGALFTVLLAGVLYADRVHARQAPFALGAVGVATLLGLVLAPPLDARHPLIDVQKLASDLQARRGLVFSWAHHYGPMEWRRQGREVLRVRAKLAAYWKAETLESFDGLRWTTGPRGQEGISPGPDMIRHPEWRERLRVTLSDMRSPNFIGAGETTLVSRAPRQPVSATAGSFVTAGPPLVPGDAYEADIYYPRPSSGELRDAPLDYGPGAALDLAVGLADRGGHAMGEVLFPAWGGGGAPLAVDPTSGLLEGGGQELVDRSAYAPVAALARRLRQGAATPYDYAQAIERYLGSGFAYDEAPPQRTVPLAAFLLRDRRGYCQQFSGAMALLLRMGGVPARVGTGFSSGAQDVKGGDYVVRDIDAHSWVEAYFPSVGWVTFDPTPTAAPARRPFTGAASIFPTTGLGDAGGGSAKARADVVAHTAPTPLWRRAWFLVLVSLALAGAAALSVVLALERRRHPPGAPELAELERALRRAGRRPSPRMTLRELERSLGPDEGVRGYLGAVRAARYGERHDARPTRAQRRALRRVLGDGLGARGRLRALWAIPPRLDVWPLSDRRHPRLD